MQVSITTGLSQLARSRMPGCSTQKRGFTILEMLVVVAVISIVASTILLNTSFNRPETEIKKHANLLGKTLQLLMQEAILEDRNFAISLIPEGYLVLEFDGEEFSPTKDTFLLGLQKKHGYSDELVIDRKIIVIEKKEKPDAHILILASGEMSIFEWNIADRENKLQVKLSSTMLGKITTEGPAESL
ncbi:MAG: prepilin-type N-terminal cleavage/methylation domain-containing protein [Gammaproteobacteria bacterium]|nr:prepilin-type N-terminal cleavage/methylation domain-containing protein [Gammaproteobacteria bacterium]